MLLEVVTRHLHTRPQALARNKASLVRAMGDTGWVHRVMVDAMGRGIPWANAQLRAIDPVGDYVWVLDDDDECILPGMLDQLRAIVTDTHPDAVMVRMDHGEPLGILPDDEHWGGYLHLGGVGCSALITSRTTWMAHRHAWGEHYAGDHDYVDSVQRSGAYRIWWKVVASRTNGRNMGAGE